MLQHFEDYGYTVQNGAPLFRRFKVLFIARPQGCIFLSTKTTSVVKAFEIGHRWHWGPHFCAEEYGVASDNVDGGGKDVYEKNEIISVVTTKKEDARLVTIIDLFAYTLVTLRQTRGRSVEKQAYRNKRKTSTVLQCVSCTEVEIFLKFYVFLLASLRFSFYCWIPNTWGGEVKIPSFASPFCGIFTNSTAFTDSLICRLQFWKVFGNVWLKLGMQVFFCLVWDGKVCGGLRIEHGERRKLVLCSFERLDYRLMLSAAEETCFFRYTATVAALASMFKFISQPCVLLVSI